MSNAPFFECPSCYHRWLERDPGDIAHGSIVECPNCNAEYEVEVSYTVHWHLMHRQVPE